MYAAPEHAANRTRGGRGLKDTVQVIFERHHRDVLRMSPFAFHRRDALLVLLRDWGVTIDEVLQVDTGDVDPPPRAKVVLIRGIRYAYTPPIHGAVTRWLRQRDSMANKVRPPKLFIDQRGRAMIPETARRLIKELADDLYDPDIHRLGLGTQRRPALAARPLPVPFKKD